MVYKTISISKIQRPRRLTALTVGAVLLFCFLDHMVGNALGFVWVRSAGQYGLSIPMEVERPVWYFVDAEAMARETSYGRPPIEDPLYGIDLYFEDMVDRGYSQIEVLSSYHPEKIYLLSVQSQPVPGCRFFWDLPENSADTASRISFLPNRFTRESLKKVSKTLTNGSSAKCISTEALPIVSGRVMEKFEVKPHEVFGIHLQYRATRRLIDIASNTTLFETREVWSEGGWFVRYVLSSPDTGTAGRGYRYGGVNLALTMPQMRQSPH